MLQRKLLTEPNSEPAPDMKHFKKSLFILIASGFLLGGCGQKGDLYLPDSETAESQAEEEKTEE